MDRLIEDEMEVTVENAKLIYGNARYVIDELGNKVSLEGEGRYYYNINNTEVRWIKKGRGYVLLLSKNYQAEIVEYKNEINTPKHYDNSKGSLYQFAEEQGLNAYEFDLIKRIVRCRKKGEFISDIDKSIAVLQIYKQEYGGNTK